MPWQMLLTWHLRHTKTDAGEAEKGEYEKLREARIAANQAELARIFGQ